MLLGAILKYQRTKYVIQKSLLTYDNGNTRKP